jgi:hypothetical protein
MTYDEDEHTANPGFICVILRYDEAEDGGVGRLYVDGSDRVVIHPARVMETTKRLRE